MHFLSKYIQEGFISNNSHHTTSSHFTAFPCLFKHTERTTEEKHLCKWNRTVENVSGLVSLNWLAITYLAGLASGVSVATALAVLGYGAATGLVSAAIAATITGSGGRKRSRRDSGSRTRTNSAGGLTAGAATAGALGGTTSIDGRARGNVGGKLAVNVHQNTGVAGLVGTGESDGRGASVATT